MVGSLRPGKGTDAAIVSECYLLAVANRWTESSVSRHQRGRAIRSTGEMGRVLEQHEDTVRWEGCRPDQPVLTGHQSLSGFILVCDSGRKLRSRRYSPLDTSCGLKVESVLIVLQQKF